jgi:hypothetical protein
MTTSRATRSKRKSGKTRSRKSDLYITYPSLLLSQKQREAIKRGEPIRLTRRQTRAWLTDPRRVTKSVDGVISKWRSQVWDWFCKEMGLPAGSKIPGVEPEAFSAFLWPYMFNHELQRHTKEAVKKLRKIMPLHDN